VAGVDLDRVVPRLDCARGSGGELLDDPGDVLGIGFLEHRRRLDIGLGRGAGDLLGQHGVLGPLRVRLLRARQRRYDDRVAGGHVVE
jgi:hypothetical protein